MVKMPWAEPSSRFTALFELRAIEGLKAASQKAVAGLLKLSWDEIHGIMERAVKRGLERRKAEPVSQMGVGVLVYNRRSVCAYDTSNCFSRSRLRCRPLRGGTHRYRDRIGFQDQRETDAVCWCPNLAPCYRR